MCTASVMSSIRRSVATASAASHPMTLPKIPECDCRSGRPHCQDYERLSPVPLSSAPSERSPARSTTSKSSIWRVDAGSAR